MREISRSADGISTVSIGYVELRAALAAAIRSGRVLQSSRNRLAMELERIWSDLGIIAIDTLMLRQAGDLAEQMRLRAYDALHLTALRESGEADEILFACWDTELRTAAKSMGYQLLPENP